MAISENLCRCGHHWWSNNPYDECPKCKTGATEAGGVDLYKRAERSWQACQVLQKPNAAFDEIQRLQSDLTAAKAEIERLRDQNNCFIEANKDLVEESSRLMDENEALRGRAEQAEARVAELEKAVDDGSDAWLLRKQADAIEPTVMMDWEDTRNLVKSLRQQADELDND